MSKGRLFTSESVTEGHPDKICDAISDSVLDALLAQDPKSRVAVETLVTTGQVHVVGEVTTTAKEAFADITNTVRERILEIGYDSSEKGFDGETCGVNIGIGAQSPDIAQGVDTAHETRVEGAGDPLDAQGAGDQGLMFGYAITDTPELMPLPIAIAHRLARRLTEVRKNGVLDYLRPDGKTQVTVQYDGTTPVRLDTVVLSTQHADGIDLDGTLTPDIREKVVNTVLADLNHESMDTSDFRLLVNPTGKFVLGGPMGDAGLTGRKIIVDTSHEARVEGAGDPLDAQGAGDQGLMFGYAIKDTPELMPLPIAIAHRLARRLTEVRKNGVLGYLRPDGKTQVTVQYDGTTPVRLDTVVLSTQHADGIDLDGTLTPDIREKVVNTVLADLNHESMDTSDFRLLVNPTGKFVLGGPMGDAGLTGRKIIVDTYGGWARHGGGAFSGKDPSKVDRSAAYAMRWVAKNVVAAGLAQRVEVQVAYAIGKAAPVGLFVETFGSETVDPARIEKAISSVFDLRPGAIVRDLDLLRPIYAPTAAYGHFGRTDIDLPWERTNKAYELKAAV